MSRRGVRQENRARYDQAKALGRPLRRSIVSELQRRGHTYSIGTIYGQHYGWVFDIRVGALQDPVRIEFLDKGRGASLRILVAPYVELSAPLASLMSMLDTLKGPPKLKVVGGE